MNPTSKTIIAAGLSAILSYSCATIPENNLEQVSQEAAQSIQSQLVQPKKTIKIKTLKDALHNLSESLPEYKSWMVCAGFQRNAYTLAQDQEEDLEQMIKGLDTKKINLSKKDEKKLMETIINNKNSWTRFTRESKKELTQNPVYKKDRIIPMLESCERLEHRMRGAFNKLVKEANQIRSYAGINEKKYNQPLIIYN